MDRKFVVVLGTSVVLGMAATGMVSMLMTSVARERAADVQTREVVVAAVSVPPGAVIRPEMVRISKVQIVSFPKGGFSKLDDVVDRAVLSTILPDEPLVEGRLAVRGTGSGLAPLIPSGMRAVSVRVNEVVGIAGYAIPGMRVDVLVTGRPPDRNGSVTATVLQDIGVVSAGQSILPDPKGQAITTQVVTLLVNPMQAETLTLASNEGHIQLILRNATDRTVTQTPGRDMADLYHITGKPAVTEPVLATRRLIPVVASHLARTAAPEKPAPVLVPVPVLQKVIVMHGKTVTVQTFEPGDPL
jgi:pilus assembly protein CpaB